MAAGDGDHTAAAAAFELTGWRRVLSALRLDRGERVAGNPRVTNVPGARVIIAAMRASFGMCRQPRGFRHLLLTIEAKQNILAAILTVKCCEPGSDACQFIGLDASEMIEWE